MWFFGSCSYCHSESFLHVLSDFLLLGVMRLERFYKLDMLCNINKYIIIIIIIINDNKLFQLFFNITSPCYFYTNRLCNLYILCRISL